jgi:hypothetical protein
MTFLVMDELVIADPSRKSDNFGCGHQETTPKVSPTTRKIPSIEHRKDTEHSTDPAVGNGLVELTGLTHQSNAGKDR